MSERRMSLVRWAKGMAVSGLFAVGLAIGAQYGDQRGAARAQRFNVAWMANEAAASTEVLAHGGSIETLTVENGWTATVRIDGETYTTTSPVRADAVLAAVADWKGL